VQLINLARRPRIKLMSLPLCLLAAPRLPKTPFHRMEVGGFKSKLIFLSLCLLSILRFTFQRCEALGLKQEQNLK
jgi:hypothetical protein